MSSSDGGSSGVGESENEDIPTSTEISDEDDDEVPVENPPRVLVFTTVMLLALLAVCRNGCVDGTFKSMSKQWKQLFIMMVNYRGAFIPVAFGWLPDKSEISYHVFLVLLLEAFRGQKGEILELFGRCNLKLKKIKLDFEKAIHNAFGSLFILKGCFFHFRYHNIFKLLIYFLLIFQLIQLFMVVT